MKRPLVTVAAGFVLGEVLALQSRQAAAAGFPGWPVWVCALIPGLALARLLCPAWTESLGVRGIRKALGVKEISLVQKEKVQGRGAGKRALLLFFVLALGGCAGGCGRSLWVKNMLDRDETAAGQFAEARVTAAGRVKRVEQKADRASVVLEDVRIRSGKKNERVDRVMVYADGAKASLAVGMEAEVRGKLEVIEGPRNPGEFDFRGYYRSKGIVCRMFGESLEITGGERSPYYSCLDGFRQWCSGVLDRVCAPEDSPVFKAVLLGDTSWLEPQVRSMYQRNGISHLLAVSGQHLAIIGGGVYMVLRKWGLGFKTAGAAAGGLVVSFGIMTGSSGSAMRAVVMIVCLWLAAGAGRSYDTLSALALAALTLLFTQPYLLFQSGFQLSFGAVLAIGGLGSRIIEVWEIEKGWQKTLVISISVQMALTPVVLYHYYLHPLYGILLNLMVIPLISVLMYSGLLGIALGSVWIQGGMAAVGAGHYILQFYERLCGVTEQLPGYSLVMGRPQWWQMAAYGAGIMGILYGGWVWMRRRDCGGSGGSVWSKQARGVVLGACAYGLCFPILLPFPVKGLEIVCLDVGQGDGIVMETDKEVILIDGGSSSEKSLGAKTLEPFLKSRGIGVIDYGIVSHGDSDHISGLEYLLKESLDVTIKNLILPGPGRGQEVYERLERLAAKQETRVIYMEPGEVVRVGRMQLTCLYAGGGSAGVKEDRNAHSLVICADYENFHMLFTGDMGIDQEKDLMRQARGTAGNYGDSEIQRLHLNHISVLKTAHHGSDTSSSQTFLEQASPKLAVISYGRGNSYGHPSAQVLERFEQLKIPVMETGTGGAVILKTDGDKLWTEYFLKE